MMQKGKKLIWRFVAVILLVSFCQLLWKVRDQWLFERSLDSLFITFDDFGPEYTEALINANSKSRTLYFEFPESDLAESSSKIPPLIHFIWYKDLYETHPGATQLASEGSNTPDLCRKYNPDYTINIWNSTAARTFLEDNYAWFLPTYDGYRYPIQRIDALKYFLLWHFGGFYLDMDVSCRRALNPLQDYPAWFPRASPMGVNNDLMASRPRHPLLWKMIKSLEPRDKNLILPWATIFWTTGPRFTTDMLRIWLDKQRHGELDASSPDKEEEQDKFRVLPTKFYSGEYTFFGHRPGGSWYGMDVLVIAWIVSRPYVLLVPVLAGILVYLIRTKACLSLSRKKTMSLP